jgi:hypothetical protein
MIQCVVTVQYLGPSITVGGGGRGDGLYGQTPYVTSPPCNWVTSYQQYLMKKIGQDVLGLTVLDRRLKRNGRMNNVLLRGGGEGNLLPLKKKKSGAEGFQLGYCEQEKPAQCLYAV